MKAEKVNYPIDLLCKVMRVSRSGFYKWLSSIGSYRKLDDQKLCHAISKIYTASRGTYGRRRVHATLGHQFIKCGKNRAAKLMKKIGLYGVGKRKFKVTTQSDHKLPVCQNLIVQDFKVYAPCVLWTADITYIATREGWLYLSIVLDAFSRAIVGWAMQETMRAELVTESI